MALDRQLVFNDVWNKLFAQGKSAVNASGECLYRAADGLKCAVGHLITDDAYCPDIEGTTCSRPEVFTRIDSKYGFAETNVYDLRGLSDDHLLIDLQRAHDGLRDVKEPSEWRDRFTRCMEMIAETFGLSTEGLPRV